MQHKYYTMIFTSSGCENIYYCARVLNDLHGSELPPAMSFRIFLLTVSSESELVLEFPPRP